ncbi:MORN-repeat protein [Orpheovirus IHUMI-LCC2]|uniref:MORN-repeat protein n=1 Tax=Orpheovirus IHUMI-LCC2 TaxID=2023057 RepID=A0A2I2L4K9_9VIRU|nr:MORN-repeat protein [Orpheovirus IHUMI-LCC2]SNW62464.1 MORN-repeat protein [Orpheovirus IHUMI-LCC2]
MENMNDDILFYKICYSDYEVSSLFPLICKRFNKLCKGHNGEIRDAKSYFLEYIEKTWDSGGIVRYWVNKYNGKREGPCQRWYYECWYKNGNMEGIYRSWYTNGNKFKDAIYKNGSLHGMCIIYNSDNNGLIFEKINYINGKFKGLYERYNTEGMLVESCNYD